MISEVFDIYGHRWRTFLKKNAFFLISPGKLIVILVDKFIFFLFNCLEFISRPSTIFRSYPGGGVLRVFFSAISAGSIDRRERARHLFRRLSMARGDQLGRQWKIIQTLVSARQGNIVDGHRKINNSAFYLIIIW